MVTQLTTVVTELQAVLCSRALNPSICPVTKARTGITFAGKLVIRQNIPLDKELTHDFGKL
jgi:hypothetical protein